MAHDGRAIANFVLDYADRNGISVTPLALQKIVYFCHVWFLITCKKPLIKHSFEAWEYGPVLQYLYREFKEFGGSRITARAQRVNPVSGHREIVPYSFDAQTSELLSRVVSFYARLSPRILVELTHAVGGPWHKVWYHLGNINPGMKIDNREIASFYAHMPHRLTVH